jgi:hypothetical protein
VSPNPSTLDIATPYFIHKLIRICESNKTLCESKTDYPSGAKYVVKLVKAVLLM